MISTESLHLHSSCHRRNTWNELYNPFRVSLYYALNESIRSGMAAKDALAAHDKLISLAVCPGIDITVPNIFDTVHHHAKMIEVVTQYLLSVNDFSPISHIGDFHPQSFLLPDGRLWRIVLCARWSEERELEEKMSWRTVADCAITNRPMLITAIVIGSMRDGFRPSRWTQGFAHPNNGGVRVLKRDGEEFESSWKRVYREHTDLKPLEWLGIMQSDKAFNGIVFSSTVDVPPDRAEILSEIGIMRAEMEAKSTRPNRSSCFASDPCPFYIACMKGEIPPRLGWIEKG